MEYAEDTRPHPLRDGVWLRQTKIIHGLATVCACILRSYDSSYATYAMLHVILA